MTAFPRAEWARLLTMLPAAEVINTATKLSRDYTVEDLTTPQSGLGLLQLRDGALAENYFLGEIPVAAAHVRLITEDGQRTEGAAQLLDDRAELARAVAILDALLAAGLPGNEEATALLARGDEQREALAAERRALLAATRVDFSLLGSATEEDDE